MLGWRFDTAGNDSLGRLSNAEDARRSDQKAMDLPPQQRLALAGFLLENLGAAADPDAGAAWDFEIRDRICEIDEGRVAGIGYADVMQEAERRLAL